VSHFWKGNDTLDIHLGFSVLDTQSFEFCKLSFSMPVLHALWQTYQSWLFVQSIIASKSRRASTAECWNLFLSLCPEARYFGDIATGKNLGWSGQLLPNSTCFNLI